MASRPLTLYEKIWNAHVVERRDYGTCLIYIDRHLVHEVTSPQAFEGLRAAGRPVRRPDLTLAVPEHNLPTNARVDAAGRAPPTADADRPTQPAPLPRDGADIGRPHLYALRAALGSVTLLGADKGRHPAGGPPPLFG